MKTDSNYYVYAYLDPRNYEMLYVGKGKGSRKYAHLPDKAGTATERRIHEIRQAGKEPVIKVLAVNLTEEQALLVEKALIWRPGGALTNVSGGHFAKHFRPPNTLDEDLRGFDRVNGIFHVNVGTHYGPNERQWEDCYKYGFLAAGYGRQFSSQLDLLSVGDIVAAYFNKKGSVGVGRVVKPSVPAADFRINGRPLSRGMLKGPALLHDADDEKECEYVVGVKWIKKVLEEKAKWRTGAGLRPLRGIVKSLAHQHKTLQFLERQFGVDFKKLLESD
jgi:hypothetical protein